MASLTATDSEVSFALVNANTTIPAALSLTNSTATFNMDSTRTAAPTDILPFSAGITYTLSKATINFRGPCGASYSAVVPTKVIGGPEISKFTNDQATTIATNDLDIVGGVAEFTDLTVTAVNVNLSAKGSLKVGGLLTAGTGIVTLNDSTATLNNVTTAGTTGAFTLGGGSIVTVAGTATFSAAATIVLQDAGSKLTGTTNGVSKIVATGASGATYTAADNASFVALF